MCSIHSCIAEIMYTLEDMWMIPSFFQILFPTQCFGCGKSSTPLCPRCIRLTRKSLSSPYPYITSIFDFKDPLIKRVIHASKYYHRKDLLPPLVFELAQEMKSVPDLHLYTLVPIPMPRIRKLLRGYNQSELIAQQLSTLLSIPVSTSTLIRTKTPLRQAVTKTRSERIKNQHGSFGVSGGIHSTHIILIDDVTTTGTTLEEARNVLLTNGAQSVIAYTLAH